MISLLAILRCALLIYFYFESYLKKHLVPLFWNGIPSWVQNPTSRVGIRTGSQLKFSLRSGPGWDECWTHRIKIIKSMKDIQWFFTNSWLYFTKRDKSGFPNKYFLRVKPSGCKPHFHFKKDDIMRSLNQNKKDNYPIFQAIQKGHHFCIESILSKYPRMIYAKVIIKYFK